MRHGRLIIALVLALAGLTPATPVAWSQTPAASQAPDCSDLAIAKRRAAFQRAYDARDYDKARSLIDAVWNACLADRGPSTLKAQVLNDYAVTLHHTGDDGGCLEMLEDYSPELTRRPTEAMRALPAAVQQALRTNYGLCRGFCDGAENYTDARCVWLRADAQFDGFVAGDFKARPCPFRAPEGAVGLPGKGPARCLVLTPAPEAFELSTADEHDASEICPGLALLTKGGGAKALKVPDKSLLRSKRFCCAEPKLAVDGAGRIEIQPGENPPEDCLFGHREFVLQDVLTLTKGRLVLVHRLHELD
jgi:hypothetical protein